MLGCTGIPRPKEIPDDWIEYTGWDCMCPLYAPGNSKIRPPKVEWGPCDFKIPEHYACQRVVKPGAGFTGFGKSVKDPVTKKLKVLITLVESKTPQGAIEHRVVFEPEDGSILVDFLEVRKKGLCANHGTGLSNKNYLLEVYPWWDDTMEGFVAGEYGEMLPSRMKKEPTDPALGSSWTISPSWIIRMRGDRTGYRWDDPSKETLIYTMPMLGRAGHRVVTHNDDIFIHIGEILTGAVAVWTEADGLRPLILWPPGERTVYDFHTDGEHMVWTEAQGWNPDTSKFAISDIYVAPYSLDQQQVSKTRKRLTKDPTPMTNLPWHVGCGYAARRIATENPWANSLMVVRLSDGYWWVIPGGDVSQPWRYDLTEAFGLTCEEVFVSVEIPGGVTIARIRLDSLGPGNPPE